MMECKWNQYDCLNADKKCYLCFERDQHYLSGTKKVMPKKAKPSARKGAQFEANNSNLNNEILLGGSRNTPNSGAGMIKGDEEIRGLINTMEELKEQNSTTSKGAKTFTIHKEWLTKLKREAEAANKEFYYLKFVFGKDDVAINDYYVIIDKDQLMSMIKTMWEDRKVAKLAQGEIDLANKRARLEEAEKAKLLAELDALKAELALYKQKEEI